MVLHTFGWLTADPHQTSSISWNKTSSAPVNKMVRVLVVLWISVLNLSTEWVGLESGPSANGVYRLGNRVGNCSLSCLAVHASVWHNGISGGSKMGAMF